MRPFVYDRAADAGEAARLGRDTGQGQTAARTQFLAGGTTLIDLMKLDVLRPEQVVDINPLESRHGAIEVGPDGLRLGALARMSAAADHPAVRQAYPVIAQALDQAASAQLRNMASLGGNLLQRTRCPYYRDTSWEACNKRTPGSGCAAIGAVNRNHAVLGVDDSCISQYPGDLAVALIALDAELELEGARARRLPLAELHRAPSGRPDVETNLEPGELITAIRVPAGPWTRRSLYLKVRDRASYEFAIASAAVALDLDGDRVRQARIGLGGMAYRPWRSHEAEAVLTGKTLTRELAEAAAREALKGAVPHGGNDHKPELGRRTLVRALLEAQRLGA
ncbi:MAG TPA: xanthine dehydrogenase family protein subunit M [Caulobacteraceae bacterium]|jgi:xanthine dehydrogenase YagS FAD-binding subunit